MEKSRIGDNIGINEGWFNIIKTLCISIYSPVQYALNMLANEKKSSPDSAKIAALELSLTQAVDELPCILQIKEKFGTLRFYYSGGTDRVRTLVGFAESMSACTCEKCGAPGRASSKGWIKTLCPVHLSERSISMLSISLHDKFSDPTQF